MSDKIRKVFLTKANDKNFDLCEFGVDLEKFTNVKVCCALKAQEITKDGYLHYVALEFTENDVADPQSDPLIFCTICTKMDDGSINSQPRAIWNNALWRIMDDSAKELLELIHGLKKEDVENFAEKLTGTKFGNAVNFTYDMNIDNKENPKWYYSS